MARQPKPYYRKAQDRWVCTIDGNRITLGKDREAAHLKFHELMLDRDNLSAEVHTLYGLSQVYLDWCEIHRAKITYDNHKRFLRSFIKDVGKSLKINGLKNHHLHKWIDSKTYASTSKNDAISIVLRMLNWAVEQGHIVRSPIVKITKPKRQRREVYYTDEQWQLIRSHVTDGFVDFLDFLWSTGCRPKEGRDLEARHVDLKHDLVAFDSSEAKGEIARVLYLTPESRGILDRMIAERPEGPLFINRRGNRWTKDAVKCRLTRISKKVNFRVIAYGTRHSYATEGLKNGVDSVLIAHLMGHQDPTMVAKTYSHVSKDVDFLKQVAQKVRAEE